MQPVLTHPGNFSERDRDVHPLATNVGRRVETEFLEVPQALGPSDCQSRRARLLDLIGIINANQAHVALQGYTHIPLLNSLCREFKLNGIGEVLLRLMKKYNS